jgi:tetratricopeptide (TPR) repeat protein
MALLKKFPKNFYRPRFFYLLIAVLLVVFFYASKTVYKRLKEPARYNPTGEITEITYTPPAKVSPSENRFVDIKEPGTKALLPGAKWIPQTFNNCGPATTSMVLQYFGFNVGQDITKEKLRTNPDDKNVFTYEIADYIRTEYGVESKLFFGGNIELIKKLVANGFYVVLEDWLHPNEDIGHVTIIRGFDDEQGVLIADDSYIGNNITYSYRNFTDTQWKPFNYEYLPVYKSGNEELLRAIVGEDWDREVMFDNAAEFARSEISKNDKDVYAWFNLGTSLYELGRYKEAKEAFENSRSIGWPKRMLWYQIHPIQTFNALGEYQKAIEYANIALWSNDSFAEAHLEKAIAYKGLGDTGKSREEAETALKYSPNFQKTKDFLASL